MRDKKEFYDVLTHLNSHNILAFICIYVLELIRSICSSLLENLFQMNINRSKKEES